MDTVQTNDAMILNPILPGFNPDPSICRVGGDYYIATSTFEWYPGVQIHHSRDLVNWRLLRRPLDRASQLDMRGNPDSCGVWAPALSHADGVFWLVYTDVKRNQGCFKDTPNYLVTAPTIEGPWSDPIYLNASGFDPSLFHAPDGRKWIVNMVWDHRADRNRFGGILLQELDLDAGGLVGPVTNIFAGSPLGCTEGPHLYFRDGWYYLLTAEGGTGYSHAMTMARSRSLHGPYELHPDHHVLTAKDAPDAPLQRAGHGGLVETPDGDVYATHLTSRPLPGTRLSPLGRESAIQRVRWDDDGWLRLDAGGTRREVPSLLVPAPVSDRHSGPVGNSAEEDGVVDFQPGPLPMAFQWLRSPYPDRLFSTTDRPGFLRLFGRESVGSWFEQSLVARRVVSFAYRAAATIEIEPASFQHMAGLIVYYNREKFHYLCITPDETIGRCFMILSGPAGMNDGVLDTVLTQPVESAGPIRMAVRVKGAVLQFSYAEKGGAQTDIGPVLDASLLSDEAGRGEHTDFTGTFVGMACQDLSGTGAHADFRSFEYRDEPI